MLHRKKQHIYLPILFTFISYSFGIKMLHRQTRAEGIQSKMKRKSFFILNVCHFVLKHNIFSNCWLSCIVGNPLSVALHFKRSATDRWFPTDYLVGLVTYDYYEDIILKQVFIMFTVLNLFWNLSPLCNKSIWVSMVLKQKNELISEMKVH